MKFRWIVGIFLFAAAMMSACASPTTPGAPAGPAQTVSPPTEPQSSPTLVEPTALPSPTLTPAVTAPPFEAEIYQDETARFAFDYPAGWTVDEAGGGDRGYSVNLTSWSHAPGDIQSEKPADGTILSVTVQRWDPTNDLDAFVEVRKQAWDASGFTILAEEEWVLPGNRRAVRFLIQAPEEQAFFLFTTAGDRYLALSGTGDLDLLASIARTLRPVFFY